MTRGRSGMGGVLCRVSRGRGGVWGVRHCAMLRRRHTFFNIHCLCVL